MVQRGEQIYKVKADQVAGSKKITTADVETIGERPTFLVNPFVEPEASNQQEVNWYLYDRTLKHLPSI